MIQYETLNEPLTREWIKDLRSGKFTQGRGHLRNRYNDQRCCLGVLPETCFRLGMPNIGRWDEEEKGAGGGIRFTDGERWNGIFLVPSLRKALGLPLEGPLLISNKLIEMNDTGASFDDIADFLENCLRKQNASND